MKIKMCKHKFVAALAALLIPVSGFSSTDLATPTPDEQALGPWLDLTGGGNAVGPAQTMQSKSGSAGPIYGSLINGTLLPAQGEGFRRINSPTTSWGTGLMISLLTRASSEMTTKLYPGLIMLIASIAQEHGGPYGPHKSHQNGLDADVVFAGLTRYESVLDSEGHVTAKFEPEKNWNFWRMLMQQQILQRDPHSLSPEALKPVPVVSMIFVSPEIKQYLCAWAKEQGIINNPLDAEILRRLRPTVGHDDHFHVRLKCSPYYAQCLQQGDVAPGTGCP